MSSEYGLDMMPAVWLQVRKPSGDVTRVDVYAAHRGLIEAARQPSPERQMEAIRKQLAALLCVPAEEVAESEALLFNDAIVAIVAKQNEERKKKVSEIVA